MDDIYHSRLRLQAALSALRENSEVSAENKQTIIDYMQFSQAQGIKAIRLRKSVYMLRDMSRDLGKPFLECTKKDVERLLFELEQKSLSQWTKADYRIIFKRFYKWLMGNNERYPEIVSWIRNREPKNDLLPEDLLTEQDVQKLIEAAPTLRDKAFIHTLFESGARIAETLTLQIKHVTFASPLSSILVNGKTGQRRIPIVHSTLLLKRWLETHPLRENPNAYLWLCEDPRLSVNGQFQNRKISYSMTRKIISKAFKHAEISKRCYAHIFRHSRATFLANHLTEAQLKQFFGWTQASDMASRYVHLSGRDLDSSILKILGNPIGAGELKLK